VQVIGTLVLNGNPTNFFAETEQVAFHTGHLVPGIEATNDPLLQGRNFSYLDTQLTRLGGPNFTQIPINRPHAPVNDNTRDGFHQHAVHTGQAPYTPNSVDDGAPFPAEWSDGGYVHVPRAVAGEVVREAPASFADHFSQPAMFYASLTSVEQQHVIDAYTFELGKCYEQSIKERALTVLARIDGELCAQVAAGLGLPVPKKIAPAKASRESPALRQIKPTPFPIAGRVVGVVAGPGADLGGIAKLRKVLDAEGALVRVIAPHGGQLVSGRDVEIVERTFATARSIEFDAVLVADGAPKDPDFRSTVLLQEAFRHLKAVGAWGDGVEVLQDAGIEPGYPGVLTSRKGGSKLAAGLVAALGMHRAWDRTPLVRASMVPPAA
jgi:catalase